MRALLPVLAFGVGFAAVNQAMVALAPLPEAAGLRAKVEFAREHLDEVDVLFVGSSATMYGLRPRVFEAELARLGHPGVRAYNLGVGGMGSFEAAQVLRSVLGEGSDRLGWVVYEEPIFDPRLWYPDVHNPRYVHWHDTRSTLDAIDAMPTAGPVPEHKRATYTADWLGRFDWRLALAREHIELWMMRSTALGRGPDILRELLEGPPPMEPDADALARESGWVDIGSDAAPGVLKAHQQFLEQRGEWERRLESIPLAEASPPMLADSYDMGSLEELLEDIRDVGAQPLLYVAPRGLASPMMAALDLDGAAGEVLRFHLPDRYPELNDIELRWDFSHLNAEGAERWSRLFAREFARHLETTGAAATRR